MSATVGCSSRSSSLRTPASMRSVGGATPNQCWMQAARSKTNMRS
jgi:hypothetical protein